MSVEQITSSPYPRPEKLTLQLDDVSISVVTPENKALWSEMGLLRTRVYIEERGFLDESAKDETGAEFDEYDAQSRHFIAHTDDGEVIGTVRVVGRSNAMRLPAEDLFDQELPEGAREISRFMVDPRLPREQCPLISMALMRAALKETSDTDDKVYAVVEKEFHAYLQNFVGIELEDITDLQMIEEYHSNNQLIAMHPRRITSQIHARDKRGPRPLRMLPDRLAPFFEQNATTKGLGRIAAQSAAQPSPEQYDRNLGFINQREHERLQESTVAIAGVGGDGGELAVTLAQLGVGKFRLADPEIFEVNNLNRQTGASYETLGRNKAEVIAAMIHAINPYSDVQIYPQGVNEANIAEFIQGSNLVIDETEFTQHEIGVMIARQARQEKLPVLMALNVGFGSYVTSFDPNGKTFEKYFGLDEKMPLADIAKQKVPLSKWIPHIPSYADMTIFAQVAAGKVPTPTVSSGVKMAAGDASAQALAHLLSPISPERSKWIRFAPHGKSIDAIDGTTIVKHPRLHFYKTLAHAALRTHFKMNPRAGY